jgi:hypothetical protein
LNGAHQFLVCVDNVNLFRKNVTTIKENRAVLLVASKEVDLEVNAEKSEDVFMSHHQNEDKIIT